VGARDDAMLDVTDRFKEPGDLVLTEDHREFARRPRYREFFDRPLAFERDVIQEAQRRGGHHQRAG
jgi:hypothetical protein